MKKIAIKKHLKPYLIYQERKTTINHAFASALAPTHVYNDITINDALKVLNQEPHNELTCVFCKAKAETWDRLVGLVKNSELRGFGHQIGNLVPCCKNCNSKKGSKDWRDFLEAEINDPIEREDLKKRLEEYQNRFAQQIDLEQIKVQLSTEWTEYLQIKEQIFNLMKKADELAGQIRKMMPQ